MKVIVAPHPDDEIIGCYETLTAPAYAEEVEPIIIYSGDLDADRKEKALALRDHVNIKLQIFQMTIPQTFLDKNHTFFFPDPTYEYHPKHIEWGMIGENLARSGYNVIFYNTTMVARYIHECKEPDKKEELLNKVYPDQKSLWEYEKKYVLFEGYCKWIF